MTWDPGGAGFNVPSQAVEEYMAGGLAYDFMIDALQGDFNELGTLATIKRAVLSKKSIPLYLDEVIKEYPGLCDAADTGICTAYTGKWMKYWIKRN